MFKQLNVKIEGLPIEEAGVEHVLRGIRESSVVSSYNQCGGIEDRLNTCIEYIDSCTLENPPNPEIMNELQSIINVLPTLHVRLVGCCEVVGSYSGGDDCQDERHIHGGSGEEE